MRKNQEVTEFLHVSVEVTDVYKLGWVTPKENKKTQRLSAV
jgi:hypothetical protein